MSRSTDQTPVKCRPHPGRPDNKLSLRTRRSGSVHDFRALEFALGEPIENLGLVPADEKYGLDREVAMTTEAIRAPDPKTAQGPLNGILAIPV